MTMQPARRVAAVGAAMLALSLVLMALIHAAFWQLALENALLGFGGGLAFASLPSVIIDAVPASDTGVATGINTIMRTMGGAVSGAVIGAVLSVAPGSSAAPAESAFMRAFLICGVVCALAVPLAALSRTRRGLVVTSAAVHSQAG
jgi:MFS family permease